MKGKQQSAQREWEKEAAACVESSCGNSLGRRTPTPTTTTRDDSYVWMIFDGHRHFDSQSDRLAFVYIQQLITGAGDGAIVLLIGRGAGRHDGEP